MKIYGVLLASVIANKTLKKSKSADKFSERNNHEPAEQCSTSGKNAYTGQEDFGEQHDYKLNVQANEISGFISIENYHDYTDCYIDVVADSNCQQIKIDVDYMAIEGYSSECVDKFWISYGTNRSPNQCGCVGIGCGDAVWDLSESDYYDQYPDYSNFRDDGTFYDHFEWSPNETVHQVPGNKFRFNFQTDGSYSHGNLRLDWQCVKVATTTRATTTKATTTRATTKRATTTRATTTTAKTTSIKPNSCSSQYDSWEDFKTAIHHDIFSAVQNDSKSFVYNGRYRKSLQDRSWGWLKMVFNIFHDDVTARDGIMKCLGDTPNPSILSADILGSNCALDIAAGDINNVCDKFRDFFTSFYKNCKTAINEEKNIGILARLETRCKRINELRELPPNHRIS